MEVLKRQISNTLGKQIKVYSKTKNSHRSTSRTGLQRTNRSTFQCAGCAFGAETSLKTSSFFFFPVTSYHCKEIIDPSPHVVGFEAAEPGLLVRVVECRLTEVRINIACQNEGSTQPLQNRERAYSKAFKKSLKGEGFFFYIPGPYLWHKIRSSTHR